MRWFEVTRHPTAEWLTRQITEAFSWRSAPTYLVRDNDRAYGHIFIARLRVLGIRNRPVTPKSPWQNGFAERLIGHLRQTLAAYAAASLICQDVIFGRDRDTKPAGSEFFLMARLRAAVALESAGSSVG
jgi:hypothetical protein